MNRRLIAPTKTRSSFNVRTRTYTKQINQMTRFLEDGDRVKVMIQFRGREQQHIDLGACSVLVGLALPLARPSRRCIRRCPPLAASRHPPPIIHPTYRSNKTGHELLGKVGVELKELATQEGDVRREGGRLIAMFKPKSTK